MADKHMLCPACGKEMAYGYSPFSCKQGILWLPAEIEATRRELNKIYGSHYINANFAYAPLGIQPNASFAMPFLSRLNFFQSAILGLDF